MTKVAKRPTKTERLVADAEVLHYAFHELSAIMVLDRELTESELAHRAWLMTMFGEAAEDLLDLSLPPELRAPKPPATRRRPGVLKTQDTPQGQLGFGSDEPVRLVAVDGRRVRA